jgi:hypothetical protein
MATIRTFRIYETKTTRGARKTTGLMRARPRGGTRYTGTKIPYEAPVTLRLKVDDIVEAVPGRIVNKEKSTRIMKVTKVIKRKN